MNLRDTRELNRGFADTLARGFELAATTAIFGLLGWLVDRWTNTQPLFMLIFGALAVIGQFIRLWYAYDNEMSRHEANLPSHKSRSGDSQ